MLNQIRIIISDFLHINIIDKPYIFLDLWSIIHFFSGMLLIYILRLIGLKKYWKYITLLTLLILYEVFEFFTIGIIFTVKESFIDIIWDVIVGMSGAVIFDLIYLLKKIWK